MQVIHSIKNRQVTKSFNEVNEFLMSNAQLSKKVTDKYRIVNTQLILERVLLLAEREGLEVERIRISTKRKSTIHFLRIRFKSLTGEGQEMGHPELVLRNSYNGESSFSISLGFYRLVCSNGLTIKMPGTADFSQQVRHLGKPVQEFTRHLDTQISATLSQINQMNALLTKWKAHEITPSQEVDLIDRLGLTARQRGMYTQIREGLFGRDTESNLWAIFNAINESYRRTTRSQFADESRNMSLLSSLLELTSAA